MSAQMDWVCDGSYLQIFLEQQILSYCELSAD